MPKQKPSTVLQTIIVPKSVASTEAEARTLAAARGKTTKVDETSTSWRFRQRPPSDFVAGSFRTISLGSGVKGVVGHLKAGIKKAEDEIDKAQWTQAYINDLPDSAFLFVESGKGKDDEDKTVPRSARHFPYKDKDGKVDLPHLRNAIARIPQAKAPGLTDSKKKELQAKARKLLGETKKSESADLTVLKAFGDGMMVTMVPPGAIAQRLAIEKGEHQDELHLALAYFGETDDFEPEQIDALRTAVDAVAKSMKPCDATVTGYGRADAASLGGDFDTVYTTLAVPELAKIREAVVKAASEAGLEAMADNFASQISLAHVEKADELVIGCNPILKFSFGSLFVVAGEEWSEHAFETEQTEKRLEIAIRKTNPEEQTVTGVVYMPDEVDAHGDYMTVPNIRKMAHGFLAQYNKRSQTSVMHEDFKRKSAVVESYLAPCDQDIGGPTIKAGSWVACVKVLDPELWQAVKSQQIRCFSLGGKATKWKDIEE